MLKTSAAYTNDVATHIHALSGESEWLGGGGEDERRGEGPGRTKREQFSKKEKIYQPNLVRK